MGLNLSRALDAGRNSFRFYPQTIRVVRAAAKPRPMPHRRAGTGSGKLANIMKADTGWESFAVYLNTQRGIQQWQPAPPL